MVVDIESVKGEAGTADCFHKGGQNNNEIQNSYKREKTRKLFLMQLQATAEEGNTISSKIWRKLDERIKQSVKNLGREPK
jgi:hypothetical protein